VEQSKESVSLLSAIVTVSSAIFGAGVFVALGLAAEPAKEQLALAVVVAALVAALSAVSSAVLAANAPGAPSAYEQGYAQLGPGVGYTAGWALLVARSTAGAAAALAYSAYVVHLLKRGDAGPGTLIAIGAVCGLALLILSGFGKGTAAAVVFTAAALIGLLGFVAILAPNALSGSGAPLTEAAKDPLRGVLHAAALLFMAFAGFGRVSGLATVLSDAKRNLVRAALASVAIALLVYLAVVFVALKLGGPALLVEQTSKTLAPVAAIASRYAAPWVAQVIAGGAVVCLLGALLGLLLGLASGLAALGQRHDLPRVFAKVDSTTETPFVATLFGAAVIAGLVAWLDFRTLWQVGSFALLVYYALTNLIALMASRKASLGAKVAPALGLVGCLGLAFSLPFDAWATSAVVLLGGHVLRLLWIAFRPVPQAAA
jgi:APA family basic amino acid/polyamine antiporter